MTVKPKSQSNRDSRTGVTLNLLGSSKGAEDGTCYLAGGGFTGGFQSLGQLTGAVAGCGGQGAKTLLSMVNT